MKIINLTHTPKASEKFNQHLMNKNRSNPNLKVPANPVQVQDHLPESIKYRMILKNLSSKAHNRQNLSRMKLQELACKLPFFTLYVILVIYSWHDHEHWSDHLCFGDIFRGQSQWIHVGRHWMECLASIRPHRYLRIFNHCASVDYTGYQKCFLSFYGSCSESDRYE